MNSEMKPLDLVRPEVTQREQKFAVSGGEWPPPPPSIPHPVL